MKKVVIFIALMVTLSIVSCVIYALSQEKEITYKGHVYRIETCDEWSKITCEDPVFALIDEKNDGTVDKTVTYPMYGKGRGERTVKKVSDDDQKLYTEVMNEFLIHQ